MKNMATNPRFEENFELGHAMKGVDFPVDRNDLIRSAEENGVPEEALSRLKKLPDRTFENVAEVMHEVAKS